jgi:LysR family transcriptional regulator, hydrogen peroxide-inducible genes activator
VHHRPGLLIQMFARFRNVRPDIKLDLIDGTAQSIEEQLIGSKAEAAIYCRPDRALDPRLNYLPLFREQMMIVLPVEHRLAARETIEIADLAGERYVQRSFCEFNDMVDRVSTRSSQDGADQRRHQPQRRCSTIQIRVTSSRNGQTSK